MSRLTTDFYRALSIIAVLAIHAAGRFESIFNENHDYISDSYLAVFVSQWARFSVPVFIFLSGYGLTIGYAKKDTSNPIPEAGRWTDFYKKRATRILVPFLVWTILILAVTGQLIWKLDTLDFFYKKGADYHFYFFHIILQMYAVFPILYLSSRNKTLRYCVFICLLILQILYSSPFHILFKELQVDRPSFYSAFFIFWAPYFYSGIMFARSIAEEQWNLRFIRIATVISIIVFVAVLLEYNYWAYRVEIPGYYNHFNRLVVILYSFTFFFLIASSDSVIQKLKRRRWIHLAGGLSFAVYLFHTWILRLIQWLTDLPFLADLFLLIILSYGFAWILHVLMPFRWLRIVFGLPENKQSDS